MHNVPIVLSAAVIPNVMSLASLQGCCWLYFFARVLAFSGVSTVLAVLLLFFHSCCCLLLAALL
jgi:hypothetical protein